MRRSYKDGKDTNLFGNAQDQFNVISWEILKHIANFIVFF